MKTPLSTLDRATVSETLRGLSIVVTGGAGYVGSAVAHRLAQLGAHVSIVDNMENGHRWAAGDLPLHRADVRDVEGISRVLRATKARVVCHLAALATIPDSFSDAERFMAVNYTGTINVLDAMRRAGTRVLTFASTCAVYATPTTPRPLQEGDGEEPLSPYAVGKQKAERAIDAARAQGDLAASTFRFFNAAGADRIACIGECHANETHAIPRLLKWAMGRGSFTIFGDDYSTTDGTCVRDYVHNDDLAWAHARAIALMVTGHEAGEGLFNLGSGNGTSVRELVETVCRKLRVRERPCVGPRRPGDAPVLLADCRRAGENLGWQPAHNLDTILDDAIWWERDGRMRVANES